MSSCMIYNNRVHRSSVSARLCLVVLFCCHMSNDHTDVLFERINDDDDDDFDHTNAFRKLKQRYLSGGADKLTTIY